MSSVPKFIVSQEGLTLKIELSRNDVNSSNSVDLDLERLVNSIHPKTPFKSRLAKKKAKEMPEGLVYRKRYENIMRLRDRTEVAINDLVQKRYSLIINPTNKNYQPKLILFDDD